MTISEMRAAINTDIDDRVAKHIAKADTSSANSLTPTNDNFEGVLQKISRSSNG